MGWNVLLALCWMVVGALIGQWWVWRRIRQLGTVEIGNDVYIHCRKADRVALAKMVESCRKEI